jgi:crotonobetainyl-CoA:carnitine CoA-transferase CaiB-like acyl-CoA transferase
MTPPADERSGPLAHVRVLDFTALVQGPMATQMLGDLGADIIKIERPEGEWSRHWGIGNGQTHGEMDSFLAFNRNKRSVAANLKDPADRDRILQLAAGADVVVENFRPGVMARLGLAYEDFRAVNERIIFASSSGWGQDGPYRTRPGQDLLAQAMSGVMHLTGERDDPPRANGIGIADLYTGLHIVIGVLAALAHREQTGEGQKLEVDLLSCMVAAQQQELTYYFNHGEIPQRPTHNIGSIWATAPFGIYPTSDGHIAVAMTPAPVMAEALDLPDLARFTSNDLMLAHRDEIYEVLAARFREGPAAQWIETLLTHDVWCATVQDYDAVARDPQIAHSGLMWDVPVGDREASFTTVGSPFRFSATPAALSLGVPRVGQHTDEILGQGAGASDARS